MAGKYSSWFSYNLTRPYPVPWFTPVTIIGGVIVTVLVSLLSVGTSGYQLIAIISTNPNATESLRTWFGKGLGSYIGSMQPTCNSATLPVQSLIYTNNTAMPYTIETVSRTVSDGTTEHFQALAYYNNLLRNCSVESIAMDFTSIERGPGAIAASTVGLTATTSVTCLVDNPQGALTVNLRTAYDKYILPAFLGRNATTKPSLLWAESVISNWWIALHNAYQAADLASNPPVFKATLNIVRAVANTTPLTANEVKSLSMLNGSAYFLPYLTSSPAGNIWFTDGTPISLLAVSNVTFPTVWIPADYLAKGLYFTVLTDLGQTDIPNDANIFANPELLAHFTQNFTEIVADENNTLSWALPRDGLSSIPFDPTTQALILRIDPSVLATEYLCQVPRLKPVGSLIIAVLIADIVLLKTIWQLYKMIVDQALQKKYVNMKLCEGCLARQELEQNDDSSAAGTKLEAVTHRGKYQKIHVNEQPSPPG